MPIGDAYVEICVAEVMWDVGTSTRRKTLIKPVAWLSPQLGQPQELRYPIGPMKGPHDNRSVMVREGKPLGKDAQAALEAAKGLFDARIATTADARPIGLLIDPKYQQGYAATCAKGGRGAFIFFLSFAPPAITSAVYKA